MSGRTLATQAVSLIRAILAVRDTVTSRCKRHAWSVRDTH